jgi:membrane protease YdiL (CAAX protease family)
MYSLGLKIYDVAGSYSAYHSFRTAVRSRQAHGEYAFLKHEETPLELAMSPFRFSYLKRSTTYIPLGIGLALAGLQYSYIQSEDSNPDSEIAVRDFTGEDALYTTAFSYGAGTGEEALTRGWLMPLFRESMGSDVWSNAAQAVIFGALHYSSPTSPFFAAGMGYYLGWVAQQDEWRLGESTFIHFWWDVMAFAVSYTYQEVHPTTAKVEPLWLPTFALYF